MLSSEILSGSLWMTGMRIPQFRWNFSQGNTTLGSPYSPPHPPPKQINLKFCSQRHIFKESVAILLRALFTDLISTLICSQISSTNQSPCKFVMIIKAIYIRIWQIWFLCQLFCIIFTITVSCGYNTGWAPLLLWWGSKKIIKSKYHLVNGLFTVQGWMNNFNSEKLVPL